MGELIERKLNIFQQIRLGMSRRSGSLTSYLNSPTYIYTDEQVLKRMIKDYKDKLDELIVKLSSREMSGATHVIIRYLQESGMLRREYLKTKNGKLLSYMTNQDIIKIFLKTRNFKLLRRLDDKSLLSLVCTKKIVGREIRCFESKDVKFKNKVAKLNPIDALIHLSNIDLSFLENSGKPILKYEIIKVILKSGKNPDVVRYCTDRSILKKLFEDGLIGMEEYYRDDICSVDAERFLEINGIDVKEVNQREDCHIYSLQEINPIVSEYGCYYPEEYEQMISICDIVGYETEWREVPDNIFLSMEYFFNSRGRSEYQRRALGMLDYYIEDLVDSLQPAFQDEPMKVEEIGEGGKCVIGGNGLHRYTLLRVACLSELAQYPDDVFKRREIREKYMIPVMLKEIDLEKTYLTFILAKCLGKEVLRDRNTGDDYVKYDEDVRTYISCNEDLFWIVEDELKNGDTEKITEIISQYLYIKSFQIFINDNFPELMINIDKEKN